MLELLKKEINGLSTKEAKMNHLREFLQILILKIVYDLGYFKNLSFVGGTALRVLYNLRRFSEDLDFTLSGKKHYNFSLFAGAIKKQLQNYGFQPDIKYKDKNVVQSVDIKFKNLLSDLNLSATKEEKLFIKLEIDTNPPAEANVEISLVNKTYIFTVAHYDLPSLYATKLHACFFRKYTKGRDFYDLVWYLGKKIKPNFNLLNNAIRQTHKGEALIDDGNFYEFLEDKLANVNFDVARKDVSRFLEDRQELKLLNKEIILKLAKN